MTNISENKNKHLTIEQRVEIQNCLDQGMKFKAIGKRINKDQTTISKEVKKHIVTQEPGYRRTDAVGKELPAEVCPSLLKAPFVCNPCLKRHYCKKDKRFYFSKQAHKEYESLLGECRSGIALNKQQFYENDRVISNGIKSGQHLYHIHHTHQLNVSISTVYRHLKRGYLSTAALDFPRVVKFKPRRNHKEDVIPPAAKIGRSHEDFVEYRLQHNATSWIEMDTVIGTIGGKAILTFDFTLCNFMFGLLLDSKTAAEVAQAIIDLKTKFALLHLHFSSSFPVILTDNGGEFANVFAIENGLDGTKESSLFFCDPYCSYQKPRVEKNHTLFRDIVPKGESFDGFTQDTVNLIFSHVNSVKRELLNGKSPYDIFAFTFGTDVASALGVIPIPPELVIQSPRLLKQFFPERTDKP